MPLHAHDGLVLAALDGLYGAVGGGGRHAEVGAGLAYSLVVERVDGQGEGDGSGGRTGGSGSGGGGRTAAHSGDGVKDGVEDGAGRYVHGVCGLGAACVLRVAYGGCGADVLLHSAAERHGKRLYAAADAEHGQLPVEGQTGQEQLGQVALGIDGA